MGGKQNDVTNYLEDMSMYNPDSAYTWTILDRTSKAFTIRELEFLFKSAVKSKNPGKALLYHKLLLIKEHDLDKREDRLEDLDFVNMINNYIEFARIIEDPDISPPLQRSRPCAYRAAHDYASRACRPGDALRPA